MKKTILIILLTILASDFLLCQESAAKNNSKKKAFLGFCIGTSFSKYFAGSENDNGGLGSPTSYDVTYEKNPQVGFIAGVLLEIPIIKHFSLRADLNYYLSKHRIVYIKKSGGANATVSYADYYLTGSTIKLSVLPKFSLGPKNRVYILFGPYFDIRTFSSVKGQIEIKAHYYPGHPASDTIITDKDIKQRVYGTIGLDLGFGINIPCKDNNFCLEMSSAYGFYDIVISPNMRQIIATLSIIYQFRK